MKNFRALFFLLITISTASCGLLPTLSNESRSNEPISPTSEETIDSTSNPEELLDEIPSPDNVTPTISQEPKESASSAISQQNYPYGIQPGSPVRTSSWLHDCKWMGVAGQVFSRNGNPVDNIIVEAGGRLISQPVLGLSITGLENGYGPGGYEIELASQPLKSTQMIWIQLKDIAGQPLSPQIYIDTSELCSENLVILNFSEGGLTPDQLEYYFPVIHK